jgi:hypothetical protein
MLKAAVASFTSVTWYPSSVANRPVVSMHVLASRPITMTLAIPCCQQHVEIGIRKAAGPPMFVDDNIARLRREIRMPFAAPAPFGEQPAARPTGVTA